MYFLKGILIHGYDANSKRNQGEQETEVFFGSDLYKPSSRPKDN